MSQADLMGQVVPENRGKEHGELRKPQAVSAAGVKHWCDVRKGMRWKSAER